MRRRKTTGRLRIKAMAVLLLVAAVVACAPGRSYEALLVLADIAAAGGDSRLQRRTAPPQRRTIEFAVEGRAYNGDLYLPAAVRAGVVLVPGLAEGGKDDPRLVAFATTLARARFAVLVPDLAELRRLRVSPDNIIEVADAFSWLSEQPELSPDGRAGLVAFSYAAGPALLAALEEPIRERVRFILAVGGYHDLRRVLKFLTTGFYRVADEERYRKPEAYGRWAFLITNAEHMSDPRDRTLVARLGERRQADADAPVDDLLAELTPAGLAIWNFATNTDPGRVAPLLAALPEEILDEMTALNLAGRDMSRLRAQVLLLHGYEDPMIPFSESLALAGALPEDRVQLFLVHGLQHVDIEPGLPDRWRLWRVVRAFLAARDGVL